MKDEPIKDPPVENLGPCMLALTAQQRRFVMGWIAARGRNASRVARAAGYQGEVASRVNAHHLIRNPKVIAALREEADRQMDANGVIAVFRLADLLDSSDKKIRQVAIENALDRSGYGRKSTQDIRVEHTDNRSTAQILAEIQKLLPASALPMIEGEVLGAAEEG
jgi:phage terminase small subunit